MLIALYTIQTRKKPKSQDVISIFLFVCYDIVFNTLFLSKIHIQCNCLLSNWHTNRMEFHRLKLLSQSLSVYPTLAKG